MSFSTQDDHSVYKRLDTSKPPLPDTLEDSEITQELFEDKYDINQFKGIPWKGILLAVFLFLLGGILLVLGILIRTDHITNADHEQGLCLFCLIPSSK